MTTDTAAGTAVDFDRFWGWIKQHPHCVLQAGSEDMVLHDHDLMHWSMFEEPERGPVVQLIMGKALVAEMALDVRDALFVQVSPKPEGDGEEHLFEVVSGPSDDATTAYWFVVAHGMDAPGGPHMVDAH